MGRALAASLTLDYLDNFAANSVYIIHGAADDNVPVWHGQQMFQNLQGIADELEYHEEPGAGHWWDADPDEEGADCVDWEPMITVMEGRTVDPTPLEFAFRSVSPWINPSHSFVTIRSEISPMPWISAARTSCSALWLGAVQRGQGLAGA